MAESGTARPYEEIRLRIYNVVGLIALIILMPSAFVFRFDFQKFFLTDLYRFIATAAILAIGSASWIIAIQFRNDSSWILKELKVEWDNGDNPENPARYPTLVALSGWMSIFISNYAENSPAFAPRITILVALYSVHYLSFPLSRMLGMYRYKNVNTGADSEGGKISKTMDLSTINEGYQSIYKVFLVFTTIISILFSLFVFLLSNNRGYLMIVFRFILVCVSVGSFCFFISRFIVDSLIFHLNGSDGKTPYQKNKLMEMTSSQAKFTKSIIIFPILPLLYGTAFFVIFNALSALSGSAPR